LFSRYFGFARQGDVCKRRCVSRRSTDAAKLAGRRLRACGATLASPLTFLAGGESQTIDSTPGSHAARPRGRAAAPAAGRSRRPVTAAMRLRPTPGLPVRLAPCRPRGLASSLRPSQPVRVARAKRAATMPRRRDRVRGRTRSQIPTEAIARRPTSTSRGATCASSGACSRQPGRALTAAHRDGAFGEWEERRSPSRDALSSPHGWLGFVLGVFVLAGGGQEIALLVALLVFLGACIRGVVLAVRDDEVSSPSIRSPGARTLAILGSDLAAARRQRRLARERREDASR
jgi:hypothetical protein